MYLHLFVAVLTASLAYWAYHQAYLSGIHLIALCVTVSYVQWSLIASFRFAMRARALGCGKVPVLPSKDPILGLDIFRSSLAAFQANKLHVEYQRRLQEVGHTHACTSLGTRYLLTDDPENFKAILSVDFPKWDIAGPRLWATLPVLGPKSVFSSNGEDWHRARNILRPAFVRNQVADLACFNKHVANLIARIPKDGSTIDLSQLFLHLTMDSSTDFLLGHSSSTLVEPSPRAQAFVEDFEAVAVVSGRQAHLGPLLNLLPNKAVKERVQRVRAYVRYYIRKAALESQGKEKDRSYVFLDELLKSGASKLYIEDQILSILLAGRDTTAAALSTVFWYLARHPDTVAKLRRDIVQLGTKDPTHQQLKDMAFLNWVVKEVLRLFPPVPTNARTCNQETVLPRGGGPDGSQPVLVAKGTPVRYSFYSMHRRKDIYGPDAEDFKPERWEKLRTSWDYLPFSGGPRNCVGQSFAVAQMLITIFKVLENFEAIEPRDEEPMMLQIALTASIASGCKVALRPVQGEAVRTGKA